MILLFWFSSFERYGYILWWILDLQWVLGTESALPLSQVPCLNPPVRFRRIRMEESSFRGGWLQWPEVHGWWRVGEVRTDWNWDEIYLISCEVSSGRTEIGEMEELTVEWCRMVNSTNCYHPWFITWCNRQPEDTNCQIVDEVFLTSWPGVLGCL